MPGDDGLRFDNEESRVPLRPESKKPNPDESVPSSEFWTMGGTFQDDDLVSQSEGLGLECEAGSKAGDKA